LKTAVEFLNFKEKEERNLFIFAPAHVLSLDDGNFTGGLPLRVK
jgi:hypothetical protein